MTVTIEFTMKNKHVSNKEKIKMIAPKELLDQAKYGYPIERAEAMRKIHNLVISYADFKWNANTEYDKVEVTHVQTDTKINISKDEFYRYINEF